MYIQNDTRSYIYYLYGGMYLNVYFIIHGEAIQTRESPINIQGKALFVWLS